MLSKDPEKLSEQQLVEQDATTGGLLQSAPQLGLDGTLEDGLADTIAHQSAESERIAGNNSDSGTSVNSLIGKTIGGHYQILSQIGTGGMGAVYEAKHLLLLKLVAIKIISAARASDSKVLMRFQQEAKAASSLIHQNIAMVSEFGQAADGSPFLVMEKVKGKPLSQVIKDKLVGFQTEGDRKGLCRVPPLIFADLLQNFLNQSSGMISCDQWKTFVVR